MLYLLDANILIDANRDYYPISRVREFWEWLEHNGTEGHVKIPVEVYEEIKEGDDDLTKWAKKAEIKDALLLKEDADSTLVSRVINEGYAPDLTDDEVEKLGRDPFLVAYALAGPGGRCVVTTEGSKPKRVRANRHIPDVCRDLGIACCNTFELVRALDFRTGWKSV
ncbi:MAG: DUF4411 family protein [Candidatus Hydrogenedentes bacterium]|nr:DUF4411 family protein [Candidatus Hydrogenedentota bacterium]